MNTAPAGRESSTNVWLAWPAFLASSWTWCIGLYLPVLLLDTYGWFGVAVFAVPNVVGVILFARGIRTPAESRATIASHRTAMVLFSIITVAFHCYFLAWIWPAEYGANWLPALLIPVPIFLLAVVAATLNDRSIKRAGAIVFFLSLGLMILYLLFTVAGNTMALREPVWNAGRRSGPILMAPVISLGFLLCPYFDLSFHRAYQAVGGEQNGRVMFAMFGALFAVMIVFTCLYAVYGFTRIIAVHLLVQSWLTMTVHIREVARSPWPDPKQSGEWLAVTLLAALLAPLPAVLFEYRSWYLAYGIGFPAYAMFIMVRRRLRRRAATAVAVLLFTVLCVPLAYAGMIRGAEWWLLLPAVIMALVALGGAQMSRATPGEPRNANS